MSKFQESNQSRLQSCQHWEASGKDTESSDLPINLGIEELGWSKWYVELWEWLSSHRKDLGIKLCIFVGESKTAKYCKVAGPRWSD